MKTLLRKFHKLPILQSAIIFLVQICIYLFLFVMPAKSQNLGAYAIDPAQAREADSILNSPVPTLVYPNPHPDAQWFSTARLGILLHWGIHSVANSEPSWGMVSNKSWSHDTVTKETYYGWAKQFNPSNYDPDKWAAAWKKAGITYAVLTTKHHDGYALWPTKYGDMNTRVYMNSRDLLKPYVDACRKYGIKVGFYFSIWDWHYPGFRSYHMAMVDGRLVWGAAPPAISADENRRQCVKFFEYTIGQLRELLTHYGKIDVIWFDGTLWTNEDWIEKDVPEQTKAWIRSLQPGIVITRYPDGPLQGDFVSHEMHKPTKPASSWWEFCEIFGQGAGWGAATSVGSADTLVSTMNEINAMGGNYLPNISPRADGTYIPEFYKLCDDVAKLRGLSTPTAPDISSTTVPTSTFGSHLRVSGNDH